MKYLLTFNESAFEGDDFFYKEISVQEYRQLQLDRDRTDLNKNTMDKIYELLCEKSDDHIDKSMIPDDGSFANVKEKKWHVGFYRFTIIHEDEDDIYIIPLVDDWYLVEFSESEYNRDEVRGGWSKDKHFYICDGWDGLVKFIDENI